jgi:GT2 family glycosyltransferase
VGVEATAGVTRSAARTGLSARALVFHDVPPRVAPPHQRAANRTRLNDRPTSEPSALRGPGGSAAASDRLASERSAPNLRGDGASLPRTTAVVSTWNKRDDLRQNLDALRAQTLPFDSIVVVDNASSDGTAEMVIAEYPEVRLIVMPHSAYGACETFNIGFASSLTELTAILDDDIVMQPDWLEKATHRMVKEPPTTAIVSTQVIEPGMPESYLSSPLVKEERYMSTFRGCASLARTKALREAGYYDERLFIYGNERDLTCRLLNRGYRVLQYPEASVFHKTPFGIKMGKRSLYYHARNAWLSMLKYAPASDLARMPWLVLTKVVLRGEKREAEGTVRDAVGTIGIGKSLRDTPGAWWVVTRAAFSVLVNVPYCLKHREPVRAPDFELPLR